VIHQWTVRPVDPLDPGRISVLSVGGGSGGRNVIRVVVGVSSSSLPRSSDRLLLEDLDSTSPLDDGESLNGRSGSENGSFLLGGFESEFLVKLREETQSARPSRVFRWKRQGVTNDGLLKLRDHMRSTAKKERKRSRSVRVIPRRASGRSKSEDSPRRLDREPPSRHETETSQTSSDSESSLPSELDSDQSERLVSRRDQGEVGSREEVRRERRELGLREDLLWVHFHEPGELLCGESTVEIDDGSDGDELDHLVLLEAVFKTKQVSLPREYRETRRGNMIREEATYRAGNTSAMISTPFCLLCEVGRRERESDRRSLGHEESREWERTHRPTKTKS